MARYTYVYINLWSTTPTFIAVLNDCYSEVMAYTALAYFIGLVSTMHMNAYVIPTNDTDYSCHIKATKHIQPIIWGLRISHHMTPLVINSLGGGHTHTHTHTCKHTHTHTHAYRRSQTETILRNQARAGLLKS